MSQEKETASQKASGAAGISISRGAKFDLNDTRTAGTQQLVEDRVALLGELVAAGFATMFGRVPKLGYRSHEMTTRCVHCGAPTRQPTRGRPRKFCCDRCRDRAREERIRLQQLPPGLRQPLPIGRWFGGECSRSTYYRWRRAAQEVRS